MKQILEVRDLTFSYPGGKAALERVSLSVAPGEFFVLCGPSGSGKSTFLRLCKPELAPCGTRSGEILFHGSDPLRIGYVGQSPENQAVTDKVWHELAFGPECLGWDPERIRRRVAETASYFGIQSWFRKDVAQLSGGQKQILNLAAAMTAEPELLLLDEPTAQLDPIAAGNLFSALEKVNRELGVTVILTEHRLDEVFPPADRAAVLEDGRITACGPPRELGKRLREEGRPMFAAMPAAMRIAAELKAEELPLSLREGKQWLEELAAVREPRPLPPEEIPSCPGEPILEAKELFFRYDRNGQDVVKGLSLTLGRGEFLALLGGNGAGKTTALKLFAGLLRPDRGRVICRGKAVLLPQAPQAMFLKSTLRQELEDLAEGRMETLARTVSLCRLEPLLDRDPHDLSGGEQQRAALAMVLLTEPELLLLDEPAKGFDAMFRQEFGEILQALLSRGVSIVMASHDPDFSGRWAHCCGLMFDGDIVSRGAPREFFSGSSYYTTRASRMARNVIPEAVTEEDVIAAMGGGIPSAPEKTPEFRESLPPGPPDDRPEEPEEAEEPGKTKEPKELKEPKKREKKHGAPVSFLALLVLIPLTLWLGTVLPGERKYYAVSLLILGECMAPFFLSFERRRPSAGELAVTAALCALGVAGRAVLYMLPSCKPVLAITVAAGGALGGETGFLVGALTMLLSNLFYAQGPWTPWQMFAMGLVGFLAGLLFRDRPWRLNRWLLGAYGFLAALLLYGPILNFSSALTWNGTLSPGVIFTYLASGFPFDLAHGLFSGLFLTAAGKAMMGKLDRLRDKYGLF